MPLLGIPTAAKMMGVSADSARRSLQRGGVPLIKINERALAVEERHLRAFIESRCDYPGRGRPVGSKATTPKAKPKSKRAKSKSGDEARTEGTNNDELS